MRKIGFIICISLLAVVANAQTVKFHRLKDLMAGAGDTLSSSAVVVPERRSTAQKLLRTGGDYRLSMDRKTRNQSFRRRTFAISIDSTLYINCHRLKMNKFRFGRYYAPAIIVNGNVYFCAVPIGPAAVAVVDRDIGMGAVGEAVASSSAISQRVYYEIDGQTGGVEFVGTDKMCELLSDRPELKEAYLLEGDQEAPVTQKYLLLLKSY